MEDTQQAPVIIDDMDEITFDPNDFSIDLSIDFNSSPLDIDEIWDEFEADSGVDVSEVAPAATPAEYEATITTSPDPITLSETACIDHTEADNVPSDEFEQDTGDVTIVYMDRAFPCDSDILNAGSGVFRSLLSSDATARPVGTNGVEVQAVDSELVEVRPPNS